MKLKAIERLWIMFDNDLSIPKCIIIDNFDWKGSMNQMQGQCSVDLIECKMRQGVKLNRFR